MADDFCACQQARKGARIRKGGPGEELALAEHLAGLAPTPQRLSDTGSLAEALVLLGREDLAAPLQQAVSQLHADQQASAQADSCTATLPAMLLSACTRRCGHRLHLEGYLAGHVQAGTLNKPLFFDAVGACLTRNVGKTHLDTAASAIHQRPMLSDGALVSVMD